MRRRTLLTTAGAGLVGLVGCLDRGTPGADDGTPSDGPTEAEGDSPPSSPDDEPRTTDGTAEPPDVTVQSLHLQYGVVVPDSPDSIGISNPDTPYVTAEIAVDGDLPRSAFTLAIGDESYDPTTLDRFYRTDWGDDRWYERGRPDGLLLFELQSGDYGGDVGLTWPGGRRGIEASVIPRLAAGAPGFSAALSVPETHDSRDAPPVDIEVTNEEDVPRRFLGALNRVGPRIAFAPIARPNGMVPPGESVTLTVDDDWTGLPSDERIGDGDSDVTYHLHYPGGTDSAEIRLVGTA